MGNYELGDERRMFMTGNEVVAWAAIAAQADIMYGYPITPQNEIMHYWTRLAPKFNKRFLQVEDEIAAGFTTLGGALTGKRAFTATAGPGNVLMQESANMAEMMRIPIVYIVQQRGGPSTATVIYAQQETTLTCFGGNGEGQRIVYSTATHQELFDYTIKAFDMAWKYRFPTFVLGDGYQAKMREPLTMYDPLKRGKQFFETEVLLGDMENPERNFRHMRNTYNTEDELYEVVMTHQKDWDVMANETVEWREEACSDAEVIILAHGIVCRAAYEACRALQSAGKKTGFFRPITLRPFPTAQLCKAIENASTLLVVESAYGQLLRIVQAAIFDSAIKIHTLLRPGVGITTDEIIAECSKISY